MSDRILSALTVTIIIICYNKYTLPQYGNTVHLVFTDIFYKCLCASSASLSSSEFLLLTTTSVLLSSTVRYTVYFLILLHIHLTKTSKRAAVAGCFVSFVLTQCRDITIAHHESTELPSLGSLDRTSQRTAQTRQLWCWRLNSHQAAFSAPLRSMLTADGLQGDVSAGHPLLWIKLQLSAKGRE